MTEEKPTSFQLPRALRTRMKTVAAKQGFPTMLSWLERQVLKSENKIKLIEDKEEEHAV
jgi:hypothetical protein